MSIFLTGTDTRHSILHKTKIFRDKTQTKLTSNSSKLTGGDSLDAAIDVDAHVPDVAILAEDDDEPMALDAIPAIDEPAPASRPKRRRADTSPIHVDSDDEEGPSSDSSEDELFVRDSDDSDGPPPPKRRRDKVDKGKDKDETTTAAAEDEKKKMAVDISYEGFAIYGRVLCLVIKRRGAKALASSAGGSRPLTGRPGGQAVMENWITSTQLPEGGGEDETT